MSPKKNGFTIVELLIVIVVIGILAAIVIVAYNGVQQRAQNSQVITGVNFYIKSIRQYEALNSSFPTAYGCLGANYPSNVCWQGNSGNYSVSTTLDDQLKDIVKSKPTLASSLMSIGITNNMRAGALYQVSPTNRVIFYLNGINQPCGIAGASSVNEGGVVTQCLFNFN